MTPEEIEAQVAAAAAELAADPMMTAVTVECQYAPNGKLGCVDQAWASDVDGLAAANTAAGLLRRHVASHWN